MWEEISQLSLNIPIAQVFACDTGVREHEIISYNGNRYSHSIGRAVDSNVILCDTYKVLHEYPGNSPCWKNLTSNPLVTELDAESKMYTCSVFDQKFQNGDEFIIYQ